MVKGYNTVITMNTIFIGNSFPYKINTQAFILWFVFSWKFTNGSSQFKVFSEFSIRTVSR